MLRQFFADLFRQFDVTPVATWTDPATLRNARP
jgi:hypothetical protein